MSERVFRDGNGTVKLSENQFALLEEVVGKNGLAKISLFTAKKYYSGKNAAIDGVNSLVGKGIVEHRKEGVWRITNLPEELYNRWIE